MECLEVLEKRRLEPGGKLPQGQPGLADPGDDLIVDVGNVQDVAHRITFELEIAPDQVPENERAPIPNVRKVINRRPAAIEADLPPGGIARNELLDRA